MQRNRGKYRMRKTGDLFKKISDTKGIFHAKLGTHTHIKKDKKKKKEKRKRQKLWF